MAGGGVVGRRGLGKLTAGLSRPLQSWHHTHHLLPRRDGVTAPPASELLSGPPTAWTVVPGGPRATGTVRHLLKTRGQARCGVPGPVGPHARPWQGPGLAHGTHPGPPRRGCLRPWPCSPSTAPHWPLGSAGSGSQVPAGGPFLRGLENLGAASCLRDPVLPPTCPNPLCGTLGPAVRSPSTGHGLQGVSG